MKAIVAAANQTPTRPKTAKVLRHQLIETKPETDDVPLHVIYEILDLTCEQEEEIHNLIT